MVKYVNAKNNFDDNLKLIGDKIAAGHVLEKDEEGIYELPETDSNHYAPICTVCGESCGCYMCTDAEDYNCPPCPGQEEVDRILKENRRKLYLKLKEEFESERI